MGITNHSVSEGTKTQLNHGAIVKDLQQKVAMLMSKQGSKKPSNVEAALSEKEMKCSNFPGRTKGKGGRETEGRDKK